MAFQTWLADYYHIFTLTLLVPSENKLNNPLRYWQRKCSPSRINWLKPAAKMNLSVHRNYWTMFQYKRIGYAVLLSFYIVFVSFNLKVTENLYGRVNARTFGKRTDIELLLCCCSTWIEKEKRLLAFLLYFWLLPPKKQKTIRQKRKEPNDDKNDGRREKRRSEIIVAKYDIKEWYRNIK